MSRRSASTSTRTWLGWEEIKVDTDTVARGLVRSAVDYQFSDSTLGSSRQSLLHTVNAVLCSSSQTTAMRGGFPVWSGLSDTDGSGYYKPHSR
jgi:hypothetical protein